MTSLSQKPPKRPKKQPRKKFLRLIARWNQLRLEDEVKPKPNPRSPFKGFSRIRRTLYPRPSRPFVVKRMFKTFPLKGPVGRASQEIKFVDLPYVVASSSGTTRGIQTVLSSQRIVSARYKTVGFRTKKARSLKPLAYEMSLQKWHYGRLQIRWTQSAPWGGDSSFSDYPATSLGIPTLPPYTTKMAEMESILVNKALLKVKDLKVNLAQAFGERKQTVSLIASSATRLANAFRKLKKGDVNGCARALGVSLHPRKEKRLRRKALSSKDNYAFAANSWLEYKFGWLPLLNDVRGAAEALAEFHRENYSIAQVTARHKVQLDSISSIYGYGTTGKTIDYSTGTLDGTIKFRFKTNTGIFGNTPHMGLSDPTLLAWELLPYSFVVDWFLPIGDYLSALTATQNVLFHDGYITYWAKRNGVRQIAEVIDNGNPIIHTVTTKNGSYRTEIMNHRRDVYANFPRPRLPTIKDPLSVDHVITALALLKQTFRVR